MKRINDYTVVCESNKTLLGGYNLRMREVPNGCIRIDAQPRRQTLWGRVPFGLQTYATNQVLVLNPTTSQSLKSTEDKE